MPRSRETAAHTERIGRDRSLLSVWLFLAVLTACWAIGLLHSAQVVRWVASIPGGMCGDVPAGYRTLPDELAGVALTGPRVGFLTDAAEPTSSNRFFCAQYEVSPHPLQRLDVGWFEPAGKGPKWPALVVQVDDPARLAAFLEQLEAESLRQGRVARRKELSPGLIVVSWSDPS